MHPAKVFYEKSLSEIEKAQAKAQKDELVEENQSKIIDLNKFFDNTQTFKAKIIENLKRQNQSIAKTKQATGVYVDDEAVPKATAEEKTDSDFNYSDESDVTESFNGGGSSCSSNFHESPRKHEERENESEESTLSLKSGKPAKTTSVEITSTKSTFSKPDSTVLKQFIKQLQAEQYVPSETSASFISDLRSRISLATNEARYTRSEAKQKEHSTFELLDVEHCWSIWDFENEANKLPLANCIELRLNEHATNHLVEVKFGKINFHCHRIILRFAKLFRDFECKTYDFQANELTKAAGKKLTAVAFVHFYLFAMGQQTKIEAKYFFEVLQAAELLNVPMLRNYCMRLLDSPVYHEYNAFVIFEAAKRLQHLSMQCLMLQRIWRFFLPFVGTKSFLELDVNDVCRFLSADTVGVNSEIEIFYAAILWLNEKWRKRKCKFVLERVMSCVRYGLLPPWFTYSLKRGTSIPEVDRVLTMEYVSKMIEDGASIAATISLYFVDPDKFEKILERLMPKVPKQRAWVFDKNCSYHYGAHEKVAEAVDFTLFKDYLKMIGMDVQNYWRHYHEGGSAHLKHIFTQKFSELAWSKMQF